MANKKLNINTERLARLQQDQADATQGGAAAAPGSTTVTVTVDLPGLMGGVDGTDQAAGSCCSKSCSKAAAF